MKSTSNGVSFISPEVFVCDEMKINVSPIIAALAAEGHDVAYFPNATDGIRYLRELLSRGLFPKLMIVDMALLAGDDEETFPDEEIDEGQITGIVLIEKALIEAHSVLSIEVPTLAKRVALYTRVNQDSYVTKAMQFSKKWGICFSRKRIVDDDGEFLILIREILRTA
jgi:hypothetical protein